MTKRVAVLTAVVSTFVLPSGASGQAAVENLGRGVIAIRASERTVYVGWRLLGTDPPDVAFNVYRASGGGSPQKLNDAPVSATTNLIDASADPTQAHAYTVRPVLQGTELAASTPFLIDPAPTARIVGVSSNEPVDGADDGNTNPDWQITGPLSVNLRAERSGSGTGRVYTIEVEGRDAAGNTTLQAVTVRVPLDR
jgi:hypothetical protein